MGREKKCECCHEGYLSGYNKKWGQRFCSNACRVRVHRVKKSGQRSKFCCEMGCRRCLDGEI